MHEYLVLQLARQQRQELMREHQREQRMTQAKLENRLRQRPTLLYRVTSRFAGLF